MAISPDDHPDPLQFTETASDPDEDELDDLDDVLDEFSTVKLESAENPIPAEKSKDADDEQGALPGNSQAEDDFAKQLQAGMADLLGQLEGSPEMQQQFESLVKELETAASAATTGQPPPPASTASSSREAPSKAEEHDFQETIRRTMQRMQESGDQAGAAANAEDSDDILAQMLKEMQGGALGQGDGDEDFSKMLLGMMEQLTNKEILYEPMKDLHDKYPNWLSQNKEKVAQSDLRRYEEQQVLVGEIVARFEQTNYSDDNAADREYIVERMQKMQAAGSPPPDLVGDMNAAQEALGDLDPGCAQQ